MIDVLCLGIMVADVITKPVDMLPKKGMLGHVDSIELFTGGNAMTAAINIARIGPKTALIGKVGQDAFGDFLLHALAEKGIDNRYVKRDETAQTSCSVALSASDGERTFLHCVGANGTLCLDDIDWEAVEQTKELVFVTGSFLLGTFDGEQTAAFLKRCKEMGKTTALDVCYDGKERWGKVLDCCMPYIDIFMPSIDEAAKLTGKEDVADMARVLFDKGVGSVVIKMGGDGCFIQEHRDAVPEILPCFKVKVVDTTGAGDSFCSGFLAAKSMGYGFKDCAWFGNAAGAFNVTAKGATTAMVPFDQLKAFLKAQNINV